MNKIVKYLMIIYFGFVMIIACGQSGNEVDRFLITYENIVRQWEERAQDGELSMDDVQELNAVNMEFAQKVETLRTTSDWTDAQIERYSDLSMRLSNVFLEMSKMPPSFNY